MTITASRSVGAAQRRAGAYQKWAPEAGVLGRALAGRRLARRLLLRHGHTTTRGAVALSGLANSLKSDWGTRLQRITTSSPYSLALFAADNQAGWQYAHWLVAHAQDSGIMRVQFGDQEWTAKAGTWTAAGALATTAPGETVFAQVFGA